MIKSNSLRDQRLVDKKIDAFCESSAKLLESIHTRHGNKAEAMSFRRNRTEKSKMAEESASTSDLALDFNDEETLDRCY